MGREQESGRQSSRAPHLFALYFHVYFSACTYFLMIFFLVLSNRFAEVLKAPPVLRGVLQLTCPKWGEGVEACCGLRKGLCMWLFCRLVAGLGHTKRKHNCAGAAQRDPQGTRHDDSPYLHTRSTGPNK